MVWPTEWLPDQSSKLRARVKKVPTLPHIRWCTATAVAQRVYKGVTGPVHVQIASEFRVLVSLTGRVFQIPSISKSSSDD
jgi:hypothetical protein